MKLPIKDFFNCMFEMDAKPASYCFLISGTIKSEAIKLM